MKNIILVRHGKSSWKYDVDDRHRPLKIKGIRNTILISEHFQKHSKLSIQAVYSSPAKRALDTCNIFMNESKSYKQFEVEIDEALYDFEGANLTQFIKKLPNRLDTVLIFGHNNAFTNVVNRFGNTYFENIPTSGLVYLSFDILNWSDLKSGQTQLHLFPKELR